MLQVIDIAELAKEAERELWSDYTSASAFVDECWRMKEDIWAVYIRSGMKDEATYAEWDKLSQMWHAAIERRAACREAWRQAAYPVYGLAHLLEDNK